MAVDTSLPFTSLPHVVATTVVFFLAWILAGSIVKKYGSFAWAESLLETHQFITATLSITLAAYVADIGHDILHQKTGYKVESSLLGYLYHLLKIYEHFDVILAVLAGKSKITKYAAFSHAFLPYWSYYRVIARPDAPLDWRFQVIGDCLSRFASRAVPWMVADLSTEETLLNLAEEGRWYPDLAINAFWAIMTFQGDRRSSQAIKSFGQPYEEEFTARILSTAILLYASYAKRQADTATEKSQKPSGIKTPSQNVNASESSTARGNTRHTSRRSR